MQPFLTRIYNPAMCGRFNQRLAGHEIVALYRLAPLGPLTRLAATPRKQLTWRL